MADILHPIHHASGFSYNPQQITDIIINNMIISKFGEVFKNGFELTPLNFLKLLALMSIGELKNFMTTGFTSLLEYFKKSPQLIYFISQHVAAFLSTYKNKLKLKLTYVPSYTSHTITQKSKEYCVNIKTGIDVNFLISLYKFLKNSKGTTYFENLSTIDIKNVKEKIFTVVLSNISILFANVLIKIKNNIDYNINTFNKEIISVMTHEIDNSNIDALSVTSYLNLLTTEQKDIVTEIYNAMIKKHITDEEIINIFYTENGECTDEKRFSIYVCVKLLLQTYAKLQENKTFIEIVIVHTILNSCYKINTLGIHNILKNKNKMIFDSNNIFKLDRVYPDDVLVYKYDNMKTRLGIINNTDRIFNAFQNINNKYKELQINIDVPLSKLFIAIDIIYPSHMFVNIYEIMNDFILKINEHNKKITKKIKIFYLTLENEKITLEKSNPEYVAWSEKKELMETLKPNKESNTVSYLNNINEFLTVIIPPKTIFTETFKPKIVTKQLNEKEKDIDTLYLREKDKARLLSALFQFRDKKDIIKSLGLPNKLNILLHGLPGTGKSTTIEATATYLQKDIYYVDLKDVKTNQELQIMFEYVNKNADGSIVVCEDIDTMTNIVLKRSEEETKEFQIGELIKNQDSQLSLEYLLNVLQGTLTLDDSIFIVTTNHIDHLDPAFYRDGRFDVKIELKLCDSHQINKIYTKMIGRNVNPDILSKIVENKYSPATIIFHIKNYIFSTDMTDEEILSPFIQ